MLLLVMMTMMMTTFMKICLFGTLLDSYLFNPFLRCRIRISVERVVVKRKRLYAGRRERIKTTPDRRWEIRPIGDVIQGFKYT